MAQRTYVTLVDDLDGTELADSDGETIYFSIDRRNYEIDLSTANATKLREILAPYVKGGRRLNGPGRARSPRTAQVTQSYDPKAVRIWAHQNKVAVPARGRIPAAIIAEFHAAGH